MSSPRSGGVLTRVLHAGVEHATSERDRRQTIAGNAMALVFLLPTVPYAVLLAFGGGIEAWVISAVALGYLLGPLLSARGYLVAGRAVPLIAGSIGMYALASVMGPRSQVQIAAFFFTGWAFNLFDSRKHVWPLALLALGPGVLFFLIQQDILLPIGRLRAGGAVAAAVPAVTVFFAYLLFAVVMFHFYRVNQGNEDELAETVVRLDAESKARLRALKEAERARERAEKADAAKTQFLAVMSHELRTPLHAVMGALELIGQHRLNDDQRALASMGRQGSRDLLALIHNVIDFASLDEGAVALSNARFLLRELFEGAVDAARQQVGQKPIEVRLNLDPSVPAHARGDRARLHQVLANLLSNAVKFTERGQIVVAAKAAVDPDGRLRLSVSVSDTGIGVEPEFREAIFERFVQAETGLDRSYEGTGLGLSISRVVAEAMGGHVRYEPRSGGGSLFRFEVMLEAVVAQDSGVVAMLTPETPAAGPGLSARPPGDARETYRRRAAPVGGLSVLIAEDNPVNQMIIKSMVKKLGFEKVVMCADGQQAVEAFQRRAFDLVLLDIQMPVMDGIAAAKAIRAYESAAGQDAVPVVAVSANVLPEHISLGLASGFDQYLSKPLELDTLRQTLDHLIGVPGGASAREQRPSA